MALQSCSRILSSLVGRRLFTTTSGPVMVRFREDLKPYGGSEETGTGTNAEVAADEHSYDPSDNNPVNERNAAQQEKDGNPLQYSGANPEVSDPKNTRGRREGGEEQRTPSTMKLKKVTKDPDSGENRGQYIS